MYSVLCVDDESALLEIAKLYLEKDREFTVTTSTLATDVLKADLSAYDAIVSDFQMPVMDGIAFLKEVRSGFGDIPFILFTGKGREDVVIEAINNGADFYLQKGGDPKSQFAELVHMIKMAIERRARGRELEDSREQLSEIIEFLPDATMAIDGGKKIILWNRAIEEMTGIPASGMIGKGEYAYSRAFYGSSRPMLMDLLFEPDHLVREKYPGVSKVGETLLTDIFCPALYGGKGAYVAAKASPLRNSAGKIIGAIESIRDITDRVSAQAEIKDARDRFRQVFEDSPVSFWDEDFSEVRRYFEELREQGVSDFRDYFSRNPSAVSHCSGLVRIKDVNNATLLLYGADSKAELLQNLDRVFSEETYPVFREELIALAGGALSFEAEAVTRTLSNKKINIVLKVLVLPGYETTLSNVLICIIDITERKQIEDALRESESKYRTMIEEMQEIFYRTDMAGNIVMVNSSGAKLAGYNSPDELVGRLNILDLYADPSDRKQFLAEMAKSGGQVSNYPLTFRTLDGTLHSLTTNSHYYYDSEGRVLGIEGILHDITERKRGEENLRESEERFRQLFSGMPSGVAVYLAVDGGEDFVFRDFNLAAEAIEQIRKEEVIGRRVTEVFPGIRDFGLFSVFQRVWKTGVAEYFPTTFYRDARDPGTWRENWVYRLPTGEIVAIYNDVTERKRAHETLRQSNLILNRTQEMAHVGSWVMDLTTNHLTWSDEVYRIFGQKPREFKGSYEAFLERVHPLDRASVDEAYSRSVKEGADSYEIVHRIIRKDTGEVRIVHEKCSHERDGSGTIIRSIGIVQDITEQTKAAEALKETAFQLRERMKELNCLVSISSILANPDIPRESAISQVLLAIPPGFQFPEITAVKITLHGREYLSDNFRTTEWRINQPIRINREQVGTIEVGYLQERPGSSAGPFLAEERKLIDTIAERIGQYVERLQAEEEARENQLFLQRLIDTISSPIFYKDLSGKYVGCNTAFLQYIGLPKEKIIGKTAYDIAPRELAVIYDVKDRELLLHPGTQSYESPVRYADGSIHDVIFHKATYSNTEGRITGLVGIITDITERKRVEAALKTSKDQLRLLLDSTAEAIYGLDLNGKCTFCNTACLRILGYTAQSELIGKNMHWQIHHTHPDGRPFPVEECRIFQAFQEEKGTHVDDEVLWKADGSSFPAEYWSYPQFRDGNVVGAVVTFLDITERRKMEALVREKSKELDRYFSSSLDLLCIANMDGQFIRLNPEWEKVLGYSVSELTGRRFLDFVHPEDMESTLAAISKLANQQDILNFENRYRAKDGSYRWIEWRSKPHGEIIYAVARDITQRKLIEESLKKANRQLNILSSITRHDINNMIMVILGYLELAGEVNKDPELARYCTNVKSATQSIRDQIAFTRVYQDIGSQDPQWHDLETIIPLWNVPEGVTLDASVKGTCVFADPMLGKVFSNLLDNSLRHGGHVTEIRVNASETADGLTIVWSDNGIGIPEDEKEKIFQRGYGKNTGLGLFLVREILSLTEIAIRENGVPGEGARFEITVPKGVYRHLDC